MACKDQEQHNKETMEEHLSLSVCNRTIAATKTSVEENFRKQLAANVLLLEKVFKQQLTAIKVSMEKEFKEQLSASQHDAQKQFMTSLKNLLLQKQKLLH